ncbi:PTS sucrose transporter subunit IIBC [Dictyobacter arantiisoli]|uniref:Uncharacterized protein n=1 Tax=Dictyobacter arantiisoli TaxID=2014874 RepID=A0A5A5TDS7_9CHLR|nr:PTS sucrose transporter subunit IIBC [Dictyobacter arantiisoli]GCF09346.1 hypothetical protein KDI_29100 [Dictyobacter arantiisoli]
MVIGALSLDQVTIGAFFGFLLSLPIALFLVFWLSAVKKRSAVILGGFAGTLIAFLVILAWAGTLIRSQPIEGANGASAFFGGVLLCAAAGLVGGIVVDLLVARRNSRDYRRQLSHE